jgi:O26-antigen biosynthesis N-acetyl-L-fucosamine transferase
MRILILIDSYLPSPKSGAKLVHDLAVEMARSGHQTTVLAPSEGVQDDFTITVEDGIRVVRVRAASTKGVHKILRGFREAALGITIWRRARSFFRENPCDLIVYYSPTIFWGRLVFKVKALWQCPSYLILRDIFPQWAIDAGVLRDGFIAAYFRRREIEQYEAADIIGVQSPANLQYFARAFPDRGYHLEVLYNWAALQEPGLPETQYRSRLGLTGKVVFFYGGNLGFAQDWGCILRLAMNLSAYPHIHFLVVGEGSDVPRLASAATKEKLTNIHVLPSVSQQEYFAMLSEFDVGLITLNRQLKTHNLPGKLFGYLYWGMPVLASINAGNDLSTILERNAAGLCISNGDDQEFLRTALTLANDADLRRNMGKNSRRLLEEVFSAEKASRQILRSATSERTGYVSL